MQPKVINVSGEPVGRVIFQPGDSFSLLVKDGDGYFPVRVVVGQSGERGIIAAGAVGDEGEAVVLMSPEEAQVLLERSRGGGSDEDDAP